jgi:hypothetical protein
MAVVEPGYEGRAELLGRATAPHQALMMDVVARLAGDSMLVAAARRAVIVAPLDSAGTVVIAHNEAGHPAVLAAEGTVQGRPRLILYSLADAGSMTSAALFAAVARATSIAPFVGELEPSLISDQDLARWQRTPAAELRPRRASPDGSGESDGRWLWIGVLALLALETWMRRERRIAANRDEGVRERAA